jgi:parallel beta-helix repeat protein
VKRGGAGIVLVGCVLLAAWAAPTAMARKINVHPGKNAIPRAIDEADSGDTLRVHRGHYDGGFEVTKPVKLVGVGKKRPVIDGRCQVNTTITVGVRGVALKRLKVTGADEGFGSFPSEVFFGGIQKGQARSLVLEDTCDAEYGINVFQSGHLEIKNNTATGFSDAGIYIGAITQTGPSGVLNVARNDSHGNNRGIIVEDSGGNAVIAIGRNKTDRNALPGEGSPDGIFLTNSDTVQLTHNSADNNGGSGIHLNSTSDDNLVENNSAHQNGGPDLLNEGTGNCFDFNDNVFGTTAGNPLVPC